MPAPPDDRIVVGVDRSEHSRRALLQAVAEARAHRQPLAVLHAWNFLDQPQRGAFDPHYGEDQARRDIERFVDDVVGTRPRDLVITLVNDHAATALVEASAGAAKVVVGARGLGAIRGAVLGSVSQHVLQEVTCPVLVVP